MGCFYNIKVWDRLWNWVIVKDRKDLQEDNKESLNCLDRSKKVLKRQKEEVNIIHFWDKKRSNDVESSSQTSFAIYITLNKRGAHTLQPDSHSFIIFA